MSQNRKSAEIREKDLRLAILRIKRGRSNTGATQVSIASVAREAGVSPALIHNHYPVIADAIRQQHGSASRAHRRAKQEKLRRDRERGRELRQELTALRVEVARLASINEVLLFENQTLRERLGDNVVPLRPSDSMSRMQSIGLLANSEGLAYRSK
jgi:AcrR family transcriptional regulator